MTHPSILAPMVISIANFSGSCIHQNIFMSHHGLQKVVIMGFPLALTLYLDCNPILFSFPLCQIEVPLQEKSVIELARRLWLKKTDAPLNSLLRSSSYHSNSEFRSPWYCARSILYAYSSIQKQVLSKSQVHFRGWLSTNWLIVTKQSALSAL